LPSATSESDLYPVLCFLHGYGEAAPRPIYEALTLHGPLRPGNSPRVTERFIIVVPQLPEAGDNWHMKSGVVRQIVTTVQTEFHGNPNQTYLTGFSYGGNGVFDLAMTQPEFWTALWSVDPTRLPKANLPRPLWLSFGDASRLQRTAFMQLVSGSREVQPKDKIANSDFVFEDRGEDHVGTAKIAYEEDRIYDWLLSKSRHMTS